MGLFDFISGVADAMNMMKARTLVDELRHSIMPYDNTWRAAESFVNSMRKKKANGTKIEQDPFLKTGEIVVGNASNYILNFNENLRVDKEVKVQPRRVIYGAYLIADGNKKPNAFAYGKVSATV